MLPFRSVPWVTFVVMAMVSMFSMGQGLSYPLLAAILARQGHGEALIGLNAAMTPIGIMTLGLIVSPLTARVGARRWAMLSVLILGLTMLAIGLVQNIWLWFPLRFVLGVCVASQFVIAETWILMATPAASRGRVLGFYNFLTSAGFALGPTILAWVGTDDLKPFLLSFTFATTVAIIIGSVYDKLPRWKADQAASSPWSVLPLMLFLALATMVIGGLDQVILAFFAIFMQDRGMVLTDALQLLSVIMASGAIFMLVYGWLIDITPRRLLWLGTLTSATLLPWGLLVLPAQSVWIWPVSIALGCSLMPIFILCMVELGERFAGQSLLAANGVFSLGWGLGGILMPPIAGTGMQLFGAQALIWVMSALTGAMLLVALFRRIPSLQTESGSDGG